MYLDRMKATRKFLSELPAHKFKMAAWAIPDLLPNGKKPSLSVMLKADCGTTACIAGWVAIKNRLCKAVELDKRAELESRDHLGLSSEESNSLFLMPWPWYAIGHDLREVWQKRLPEHTYYAPYYLTSSDLYRTHFDRVFTPAQRQKAVLRVLDHIIEYGFTWIAEDKRSARITKF